MEDRLIITPNNHVSPAERNFGGIEEEYASFKRSKVAVMQVPYEKTAAHKKGTARGPAAIIDASRNMALFDDELSQETYRIGIHTMDALEVENLEPAAMVEKICASTLEVLKANKFPVMLGGEHLISVGAVKAFKEIYPNLSVLQLDAHCGLRNEHMGSRLNEACVARRLSEICPLVQVGVRSLSKEEKDYLAAETNGREVKAISVYDILDTPMWKDKVVNSLSENVYVTIDLAVFDPSVMPAVGTPEPGGMGWYEAIDLLKEVSKDRKVAGFDVVGLCPIENQSAPDFFASKLIYRFLGYIFSGKK